MRKLFYKIGKQQSSLKKHFLKDQFNLTELLGEGPFGTVHLAEQKENKVSLYAVKIIKLNSKRAYKQLKNDIKYLQTCKSQHLVSVYCCFEKKLDMHIVTDYMAHGSLSDIMTILGKPFDERVIAHAMTVLLKALDYLHNEKQIIHGDIRASNLLLNQKNQLQVNDFGIAAKVVRSMARATMLATPYWKAPEHISSDSESYGADMWAVGITAIELAEGKPPLAGIPPMKALFEIPNRDPPTVKNGSELFKKFLAAILVKDPSKRADPKTMLDHPFIKNHVTSLIPESQASVFEPLVTAVQECQESHKASSIHEVRSIMSQQPGLETLQAKLDALESAQAQQEKDVMDAFNIKRKALLLACHLKQQET